MRSSRFFSINYGCVPYFVVSCILQALIFFLFIITISNANNPEAFEGWMLAMVLTFPSSLIGLIVPIEEPEELVLAALFYYTFFSLLCIVNTFIMYKIVVMCIFTFCKIWCGGVFLIRLVTSLFSRCMKSKPRTTLLIVFSCMTILLCSLWMWQKVISSSPDISYKINNIQLGNDETPIFPFSVTDDSLNKRASDHSMQGETLEIITATFYNNAHRVYEYVEEGSNAVPQTELAGELKKLAEMKTPFVLSFFEYDITSDIIDQLESFPAIQAILFCECTLHESVSAIKFSERHSRLAICRCSYSESFASFLNNARTQSLYLWRETLHAHDLEHIMSNENIRFLELSQCSLLSKEFSEISARHCNVHTMRIKNTFISKEMMQFFAQLPYLDAISISGHEESCKISELKSVTMPGVYDDFDYQETDGISYISWSRKTDQN
ncbi:MAG: hypothetical protein Q4G68_12105 [Planctomycetia bacterium]|nr:hypothetical protein [Planctomycetia bacterium]